MKKQEKLGFTLIELLAVIVILGVIMIIAIPSVTGYITNSRKDSYVSDAKMFISAAKTKLTADASLPHGTGEKVLIPISEIPLDKGGEKSPFGNDWVAENSYVIVQNIGTSSDPEYVWEIALEDVKGNCIPLTNEVDLKRSVVGTGCNIYPNGVNTDLNLTGTIPEGGIYFSGVTNINLDTLEVTAANTYTEGQEFPTVQIGDVYMYGVYGYAYSLDSSLAPDPTMNGWTVMALDKSLSEYPAMLESINGKAIVALIGTFMDCTNLTKVPAIPESVTNMIGTFQSCTSLSGQIAINNNLEEYDSMFWGTEKPIEVVGTISTELKAKIASTATMGNVTYPPVSQKAPSGTVTGTLVSKISSGAKIDSGLNFNSTPTEETSGVYIRSGTESSTNPIYYYRGIVNNNNVSFAGFCWKIVRTTETGGVKLIYNGVASASGSCNNTGDLSQIGRGMFNVNYNDNAYVGYMYGQAGASTYDATHANNNNSTIKTAIDNWYGKYMTSYTSKLEDTVWCNDRSLSTTGNSGNGISTSVTYYGAYGRNVNSGQPSLACVNANDKFTVNSANGNGKLTYPVGLLTADEATLAGSGWNGYSASSYLNSGNWWWLGSPSGFNGSYAIEFVVGSGGYMSNYYVGRHEGLRPSVSLKPGTGVISGDGSTSNPYVIG